MTFSCASLTWTPSCLDLTVGVVSQSVNVKQVKMEALRLVRSQWHQQSGCCPSASLQFSLLSSARNHSSAHLGRPLLTLARRWSVPPPFSWGPWMLAGWQTCLQGADEVNALKEGEGPERSCCSSALCSSGEGMTKAPGFIDPCSWSCP